MYGWKSLALMVSMIVGTATSTAEENTTMTPVDLIVEARYLVTMDSDKRVLEDAAVAVKDGVFVAVGRRAEIKGAYTAPKVISGGDRALMPGFVNGHTHSAMVLFRGMADDLDLMTWLQKYIFPMEGRYVDEALIEAGTSLACYEMIQGGTTSFVDMYFYPDVIASVVDTCGLRATISAPMIDFPSPGFKGWEDSYAAGVEFVKRWKGKHPRITPALAPHAPYTVVPEHLKQAFETAKELDVPVSIHVAEDMAEIKTLEDRYGATSIDHLEAQGMFDVHTIAAHVVWPNDDEIRKLADASVGAIHNPTSNMKTAAGVAPVPAMMAAGVKVGLGTDGAASNNDLDMWEEMRLAALIHKGVNHDPTLMPAMDVLNIATKGGAEAAGFPANVGAIEVGAKADFIQVDLDKPRLTPLYDIVSHLVYAATASDVVTTVVDGKVLMENREVLTLDIKKINTAVAVIADKIREDLKAVE